MDWPRPDTIVTQCTLHGAGVEEWEALSQQDASELLAVIDDPLRPALVRHFRISHAVEQNYRLLHIGLEALGSFKTIPPDFPSLSTLLEALDGSESETLRFQVKKLREKMRELNERKAGIVHGGQGPGLFG
jgi:hypothetical protein